MRKNLLLTFFFSFIPGASQMYMTYMKRGLSIMTIFIALSILSGIGRSPLFFMPIILVMAWSFFDTWNLRNMSDEKRKEFKDELVWNTEDWKNFMPKTDDKKKKFGIGITLIVIGAYVMLLMIFGWIADYFGDLYFIYHILRDDFLALAVAALVVFFGIKLIKD